MKNSLCVFTTIVNLVKIYYVYVCLCVMCAFVRGYFYGGWNWTFLQTLSNCNLLIELACEGHFDILINYDVMYIFLYICVYVCVYMYMCVYMNVYIHRLWYAFEEANEWFSYYLKSLFEWLGFSFCLTRIPITIKTK